MGAKSFLTIKEMLEEAIKQGDTMYKVRRKIAASVYSDSFKRSINSKPRKKAVTRK